MRYSDRLELYQQIEKERNSVVLTYVTSDRLGMETSIAPDVIDSRHDWAGILHTSGGRLGSHKSLRMFCDELEVLVP